MSFNGQSEQNRALNLLSALSGEEECSTLAFRGSDSEASNLAMADLNGKDSEEKSGSRRAMNSTAYRIFKLLQWLIQSPLSVEALNAKFCADPLIGKPVSNDSIWLYINTLKALGCNIGRPSPKNNFHYEMISHPFGLVLTDGQLDSLSQAKAFAQRQFSRQEMKLLDSLLKKIISFSVCDDSKAMVEQLFTRSRSFDYEEIQHHVERLEQLVAEGQLARLTYHSPQHGEEQFQFLPVALYYDHGVLYVRGERPEYDHPSSLRVDRILAVQEVQDDDLKARLLERQQVKTELMVQVMAAQDSGFTGFGLGVNHGVYQESMHWVGHTALSPGDSPYFEVKLQVREFFYLKQRLLLCGLPFKIIGPESFRAELRKTLEAMRQFYQHPEDRLMEGNGNG